MARETKSWTSNYQDTAGNFSSNSGTVDTPIVGTTKSITDVVVPNFKKRSARGEIFINPLYIVEEHRVADGSTPVGWLHTSTNPTSYARDTYTQGGYHILSELENASIGVHHATDAPIDVSRLHTLAGTKAKAAVKDPIFNGSVFLGELKETIGMLRNPLRSYHNLVKNVHRDKYRRLRPSSARTIRTGQFLEENWLSYRYGVRPILQDANDAIQAIKSLAAPRSTNRMTARGTASDSASGVTTGVRPAWNGEIHWENRTTANVSVRAGVLYEEVTSADNRFGTSISEIPLTIWELIPYSFVLDWFVNVGPYVDALTPKIGIKELGSWTTTRTVMSSALMCSRTYNQNGFSTTGSGNGASVLVTKTTNRAPGVSVGLATRPTPLDGDIGAKRILDLTALIDLALDRK